MTLFPLIFAFILEQIRPLPEQRVVLAPLRRFSHALEGWFNDGEARHGIVAWGVAVLVPSILMLVIEGLLWWLQPLLAFLLSIATLYLVLGFRHFSHFFTDIQIALRNGEVEQARELLSHWRGRSGRRLSSTEVARLAIEEALLGVHQHVFAPMFWFAVIGPAGAVLYRLALFFRTEWGHDQSNDFGRFAIRAFDVIDWLPLRLTAIGFAIVGDFEDALYCWRNQAQQWPHKGEGVLLASGAGALGVQLGSPLHGDTGELGDRPTLGLGEEADADFLQSTIGLAWRTLALGLLLLTLLWVASWV